MMEPSPTASEPDPSPTDPAMPLMPPPSDPNPSNASPTLQRRRFLIRGLVQGVGFRPFVHATADRLGLAGWVANDPSGVVIEVQGPPDRLDAFRHALLHDAPPLAVLVTITDERIPPDATAVGFTILPSRTGPATTTPVPPDIATCEACLRELFDPTDRRFRYPFLNCTDCGPRFTILERLPYDRPHTTMARFPLCPECLREYLDPHDRRFHAQPIACPSCGPTLWFVPVAMIPRALQDPDSPDGWPCDDAALAQARQALDLGLILAIKGVGGFHFACDARNESAVSRLRVLKGRGDKPFALMVRSIDQARRLAHVNDAEALALSGRDRPIVLLRRQPAPSGSPPLAPSVAPGLDRLGIMLPYAPIHPLLLDEDDDRPLVMTSGNRSDEPIAIANAEALDRLSPIADAFLLHNRPIQVSCDDSVLQVVDHQALPLRRSRGIAPLPLPWPIPDSPTVLAVGAELKGTFCLARPPFALVSQHLGDWGDLATQDAFERSLDHMQTLFQVDPRVIACDLHPDAHSSRWAEHLAATLNRPLVRVQHHHAHAASLLLDHDRVGSSPLLTWVCDGTGYGSDGTIWGGECLLLSGDGARVDRLAHLSPIPLPGGDAAIRHPSRSALAHLWAAGIPWDDDLPCVLATSPAERRVIRHQLETGLNCVATSSMGRLFDAVASLLSVRSSATFEGQAALELEALAALGTPPPDAPPCSFSRQTLPPSGPILLDPAPLWPWLIHHLRRGTPLPHLAAAFHHALANSLASIASDLARSRSLSTVGLTGGVFQNALLASRTVALLRSSGVEVLTHRRLPANDGGLSPGQALVASRQHPSVPSPR
ncbi:carbamoyltransferase HypF [Tautonia rosea]|uniref:carbamoyltransferase HypF n=1 Tax=Tautonia rosea TaxID=2728037 RepID=UPI0019D2BC84|nr:carbamoyltransferase HypF [Tautonia rosea]